VDQFTAFAVSIAGVPGTAGRARQVAYCGGVQGFELSLFAHAVAVWDVFDADISRLQVLRDELDLLIGGSQTGSPISTRLVAWAGVMSLSAAGAIVWRTARATKD